MIAAKSDEMALPGLLKALQSPRHTLSLISQTAPLKHKPLEWATRPVQTGLARAPSPAIVYVAATVNSFPFSPISNTRIFAGLVLLKLLSARCTCMVGS